ncbi:MAG TPA: ATP-binding cassette domain-containing protein [Burkholderiaceae bacterium]|nr:ATP-binding cassette domain-containing protein [Burkholderiaceae bacterium]
MNDVLVAERVNKTFGAVVAAADINVKIERDSVVSLIGANGAGKTTFLNMITGYLQPSSGHIRFEGKELTGLTSRAITRLGISRSFQIPQLMSSLSVRDNLRVAESIAGALQVEQAVGRLLEQFGLASYAERAAALLPEGVRKLLDVAMALVARPRVLLLDEPTSGVAADEKFGIMDLVMGAVRGAGVTVLFVEHDMDIVARYSQRVVAFYDGRIIGDGDPAVVLASDDVRKFVIGEEASRAAA